MPLHAREPARVALQQAGDAVAIEQAFEDREGTAVQRLRLRVLFLLSVETGEPLEGEGGVKVLGTEHTVEDLDERDYRERDLRVLRSERRLLDGERALEERLRVSVPAFGELEIGQYVEVPDDAWVRRRHRGLRHEVFDENSIEDAEDVRRDPVLSACRVGCRSKPAGFAGGALSCLRVSWACVSPRCC
jgi:hypothetical protein